MSTDGGRPLNIDRRDLEDPTGLIRLGLQILRTGLPGGDRELQASILRSCSEDEIHAAISAAAAFEVNFASASLGVTQEEVIQRMLEAVPDSPH